MERGEGGGGGGGGGVVKYPTKRHIFNLVEMKVLKLFFFLQALGGCAPAAYSMSSLLLAYCNLSTLF